MGNICKPSCMKKNGQILFKVKSSCCFSKPLIISIDEDDIEILEYIENILQTIKKKKKEKKLSNSIKEPELLDI